MPTIRFYRNSATALSFFALPAALSLFVHGQDLLPPDADAILGGGPGAGAAAQGPLTTGDSSPLPPLTALTSLDAPAAVTRNQDAPPPEREFSAKPPQTPVVTSEPKADAAAPAPQVASLAQAVLTPPVVSAAQPESFSAVEAEPDPKNAPVSGAVQNGEPGSLAAAAADATAKLEISLNIIWVLICGFLVMFMQAGFAMVEAGFTRAKNVAHTMSMNFMVYAVGMLGYWLCGFAFQFGGTGSPHSTGAISTLGADVAEHLNSMLGFEIGGKFIGLLGNAGYMLAGDYLYGGIFALFLFNLMFMDTAATIPTGAMAERWKFAGFLFSSFLVGAVVYPVFACWVWGGGWLAGLGKNFGLGHGHVDFAGSSVVHLAGGMLALVGAFLLGPRYGKYNKDGSANPIPGHNLTMGFLGSFVLAFGWFGFNAGSTLSGFDPQIGIIAANTMLAGAAGAVAGMFSSWKMFKKPDPSFMCNGLLAGLVSVTAPCAFVDAWAAVVIGAIGGLIVVPAALFIERALKIDDPVGAVSVHGVCGIWGCLALGLFANGKYGEGWNGVDGFVTGLFYGDTTQILAQLIGVSACIIAVGGMAFAVYGLTAALVGLRSDVRDEVAGLDLAELGALGYQPDLNPDPR